jgi:hypothetical protein
MAVTVREGVALINNLYTNLIVPTNAPQRKVFYFLIQFGFPLASMAK